MPGEEAGSRKGSRVRITLSQGCPCKLQASVFMKQRQKERQRQRLRIKRTLYSGGARNIS